MRVLCALLVLLTMAQPATSTDPTPRILLIVDASASMIQDFGSDGGDRIGAVRDAVEVLTTVLDNFDLDPAPELAIRTYGGSLGFTSPGSCSDSDLLLGWTTSAKKTARSVLDDLQPHGQNALAQALTSAADDLGQTGPQDLVLVILDDLDTCNRDVTTPAETLTQNGEGATLVVLGLGLSQIEKIQTSGWAVLLAPKTPADLSSNLLSSAANHLGLSPPTESMFTEVSLTLPTGLTADIHSISLTGQWAGEELQLSPSAIPQKIPIELGNAVITAADENGDVLLETTRIPVFPGRDLALELPPPRETEIDISLSSSGWDVESSVIAQWTHAPEGELRAVFSALDSPSTTWWSSLEVSAPSGSISMPLPDSATTGIVQLQRPLGEGFEVVARATVEFQERQVELTVPEKCLPGTVISVSWEAIAAPGDLLTIVPVGTPLEVVGATVSATEGSPSDLVVPQDLCTYEVRYLGGTPYRVLARSTVEAYVPLAGLLFSNEVPAGRPFEIRWWGPEADDTVITISDTGSEASDYLLWDDLTNGSPVQISAPRLPGEFEVRIVSQGLGILIGKPLTVTEVLARVTAPSTVQAGRRLTVEWVGPAGANDFLALVPTGEPLHRMNDFVFVSAGSPTSLAAPSIPGKYDVRYVAEDPRRELAQTSVEVQP